NKKAVTDFSVVLNGENSAIKSSHRPIKRFVGTFIYIGRRNGGERLPPGGRDALRKYAGGIFLAKAGSKLCLRPGLKAVAVGDRGRARYNEVNLNPKLRRLLPSRLRRDTSLPEGGFRKLLPIEKHHQRKFPWWCSLFFR
ncbi:MAG: hypothetical protein IIX09_01660, partial [Clostridia bacterium]|nr:hypothetical protein [Clostridia bacterium]